MQISRIFYLSYRDQRNQPYSHKQTPSVQNIYLITLRLHEYHLVDEFMKKTTSINNLLQCFNLYHIKVHCHLLFCCAVFIRDYLALNVYVALCYYKLDYYDVSQASILKFNFFFSEVNLITINIMQGGAGNIGV